MVRSGHLMGSGFKFEIKWMRKLIIKKINYFLKIFLKLILNFIPLLKFLFHIKYSLKATILH